MRVAKRLVVAVVVGLVMIPSAWGVWARNTPGCRYGRQRGFPQCVGYHEYEGAPRSRGDIDWLPLWPGVQQPPGFVRNR